MSEVTRTTLAGATVIGYDDVGIRVTQAGWIIVAAGGVSTPSVVSVWDLNCHQAKVTGTAFSSEADGTHEFTRIQVRLAGSTTGANVWDSGWIAKTVDNSYQMYSLWENTAHEVQINYKDTDGLESGWSLPFYFETPTCEDAASTGSFDWDDWAQMWHISKNRIKVYTPEHHYEYRSPGGWEGPISGPTNPSASFRNFDSSYNGNVGCFGRIHGPVPAALVNKTIGANDGVNAATKFSLWSWGPAHSWEGAFDAEFTKAGLAALVCGTVEADLPEAVWGWWRAFWPWTWTPDREYLQGVYATVAFGASMPFHWCPPGAATYIESPCCTRFNIVDSEFGWPGWGCYQWYSIGASLEIGIYFQGQRVFFRQVPIPWRFATGNPGNQLCAGCRHYPWYGIRLKVWHDYGADSTGKTHRIQAAVTPGYLKEIRMKDRGVDFTTDYGFGVAPYPDEEGPWLADFTWVGGHDETTPGSGDGGLRCGWTGYCSDRLAGVPDRFTGAHVYGDMMVAEISDDFCGTPCTATTLESEDELEIPQEEAIPFPAISPCPPDVETADKELYLGAKASTAGLFKFGGYEVEAGRQLKATIQPNPISPAGAGGVCHFRSIFVVIEHISDIIITVYPILNGERLDQYKLERFFAGPGDRAAIRRYEVPLYRAFEDAVVEGTEDDRFKYGLRGTYFTFHMEIVDICGVGLQLPGVWIEYDPVREDQNTGVVYTEDLLRSPVFVASGQTFIGTKGYNRLLKAASGVTDDEIQVEARIMTNPVSPAGAAGECLFKRLILSLRRWNANPMDLKVTPYLDGEPLAPITVNYKAATAPVEELTEIDLNIYYRRDGADAVERFRHGLRGAWFHAKIETGSGLQEWLAFNGVDLDYVEVRESLQTDVR